MDKSEKPNPFPKEDRHEYVELLRKGVGEFRAARAVGVEWRVIERILKKDGKFRTACQRARHEALASKTERVEKTLYDLALGGNVKACLVWLYNHRPEIWQDRRSVVQSIHIDKKVVSDETRRMEKFIMSDTESIELTHRLLERVAFGQGQPSRPGLSYQPPCLDSLQAPSLPQPEAGGGGGGEN